MLHPCSVNELFMRIQFHATHCVHVLLKNWGVAPSRGTLGYQPLHGEEGAGNIVIPDIQNVDMTNHNQSSQ